MNNFIYYSPTEFVFGKNTEHELGVLIKKYQGTNILVHYGQGSAIRSGLLEKILKILNDSSIKYFTLGGVKPNPVDELVYEGIELCRKENIDFILAVGGGSVIDSAKAIGAGVNYQGDFWDLFDKKGAIEEALPIGTILTIPAAGSEGSGNAVITKINGMYKRGIGSPWLKPKFSILNPENCYTLTTYQMACGIADMMAHIIERYFTNTPQVAVTDRISEGVLKTIIEQGQKVIEDRRDYQAWANLMWSGTLAHNGICGTGREEDWSSHALEHELSALYDVPHGAGLAVVIPAWMRYVVDVSPDRFLMFAQNVMEVNGAGKTKAEIITTGIDELESFFRSISLPTNFRELGADMADIDILVAKLNINSGGLIGRFKKLDMTDARKIYLMSCK
ncbi:MAG: iron-containing alcohol dehydrogenase [Fusobacteria bacterium]|nr:iron-containing alcohol dehydrogenase [Fusobacteriota bacterium]